MMGFDIKCLVCFDINIFLENESFSKNIFPRKLAHFPILGSYLKMCWKSIAWLSENVLEKYRLAFLI